MDVIDAFARRAGRFLRSADDLLRPSRLPDDGTGCRNILLPQFQAALGAMVHATPVVESIAAALPGARIVVTGNDFAGQIYGTNPHVTEVRAVPDPVKDFTGAVRLIRSRKLFDGEPYVTLLTTGNERSKVTIWSALAGTSLRIGFAVRPELVHRPLAWNPDGSQISNNLRLLEALGHEATQTEPRIYVAKSQAVAAERRLNRLGSPHGRRRIAMVTQTSPTQRKQWRAERWIALAEHLIRREQADLIFAGTAREADAVNALRARIPHTTISVAGQTGIADLAAIFTRCDFGVTLDTGPLHVARAVDLPMVVIAPAWSPVHEWLPVGDPRYAILKNANFAPPAPDGYVIDEVSLHDVLAAADGLMESAAANRETRGRYSFET